MRRGRQLVPGGGLEEEMKNGLHARETQAEGTTAHARTMPMSKQTDAPLTSNRVLQGPAGFQAYCRGELIGTYATEQHAWDEIGRRLTQDPQGVPPEQPQSDRRPLTGNGPVIPPGGTV